MYISQCLIVKNEEKNIEHCLSHLKSVVDEQIVVDTGSTDRTVEIAESLGAKIYYFDWINDFSAARNFAIDKAKGDWIIFLDCDEYFSEKSVTKIKECIQKHGDNKSCDGLTIEIINIKSDGSIISTAKNISPRIYKRKKNLKYKNRVHEVLFKDSPDSTLNLIDVSKYLQIYHTGYDAQVLEEKDKNERNINLLLKELDTNPDDIKINYYLSKQFYMDKRFEESIKYCKKALENNINNDNNLKCLIYSNLINSMLASSHSFEDINDIFIDASNQFPKYPDFYFFIGRAALLDNKISLSINYLEKCINYCEGYSDTLESLAVANIKEVYKYLINAYLAVNNNHKVVELSVAMLRTDKYDLEILILLIKTFLKKEKEYDIIIFLNKIYDYNNVKDKLYLMKSCEIVKNDMMAQYYKGLFTEEELNALKQKK